MRSTFVCQNVCLYNMFGKERSVMDSFYIFCELIRKEVKDQREMC